MIYSGHRSVAHLAWQDFSGCIVSITFSDTRAIGADEIESARKKPSITS